MGSGRRERKGLAARVGAVVLLGLALLPWSAAMAVEEPSFVVVSTHGALEIRRYPALIVAETQVEGAQGEAVSRGFRRLAGYIFGGNGAKRSIAMTAPVALAPGADAAVNKEDPLPPSGAWTVRFVMPRAYDLEALPPPLDPSVRLRRIPGGRYAVLAFSGLARTSKVGEKARELQRRAQGLGLKLCGPPALLQYDPPWTLWFMRRNEVAAPLDCPDARGE